MLTVFVQQSPDSDEDEDEFEAVLANESADEIPDDDEEDDDDVLEDGDD